MKAKELTGQDLDIAVADINTDITVKPNINELARTEGIVSILMFGGISIPLSFTKPNKMVVHFNKIVKGV